MGISLKQKQHGEFTVFVSALDLNKYDSVESQNVVRDTANMS